MPCPHPFGWSSSGRTPTVGDLDGDGVPEIVLSGFFRNPLTRSTTMARSSGSWTTKNVLDTCYSNVVLADLDGDGTSEILHGSAIVNSDGTLRAELDIPRGYLDSGRGGSVQVVDLDLDGVPEIVNGPTAYDRDGKFLWGWTSYRPGGAAFYRNEGRLDEGQTTVSFDSTIGLSSGWTAAANLDDDPNPEIIAVSAAMGATSDITPVSMWIFEHDGRVHAGPFALFQPEFNQIHYQLGPPTLADPDGDGQPEIAVAVRKIVATATFEDPTREILSVYETDGTLAWRRDMTPEGTGNFASVASAFDFDGDVLGNTGFLEGELTFSNGFSTPMTLDANGDGSVFFPEQTDVTWVRLTATSTMDAGASLVEFMVTGSYVTPGFLLNEGEGRRGNNKTASEIAAPPCDPAADLLPAVEVSVRDHRGGQDTETFQLDVTPDRDNNPPQIVSTAPDQVVAGSVYRYDVEATDADTDPLSFDLPLRPAGMTIQPASGVIAWNPQDEQVGVHDVIVRARDIEQFRDFGLSILGS